jgi:phenylacetic acid degradation operon negative regulatory protein
MPRAISVSRRRVAVAPGKSAGERIAAWIRADLARHPPRAKSLVVTVWGDALAPHGGAVWLGGLIRLLAPLGLNERLVRTSVYRLTQEGWLTARQHGRQSLYRLTAAGRQRFEHAYRRIYAPPPARWDGAWDLVLLPAALRAQKRRDLGQELRWEGFGALAPTLFIRPAQPAIDLWPVLGKLDVKRLVVLRAHDANLREERLLRHFARACWDLRRVAAEYRTFLGRFERVLEHFRGARAIDPAQAFVVRSLLIHAFRRVTLHDPRLPEGLAPAGWIAPRAYALCRDFYRLTRHPAELHLAATLRSEAGPWPRAAAYFYRRFGGL